MDKLYYINLDSRKDRLEHLEKNILPHIDLPESKKIRMPAVDHTHFKNIAQRAAGCSLSHTNCWKDAIKKGYEKIIIMEDDFELIHDDRYKRVSFDVYDGKINKVIDNLKNINFSICNLGYRSMSPLYASKFEGFFRCDDIQTTSCYAANTAFLSEILPSVEASIERLMQCKSYRDNAIDQVWKEFQYREDWFVSERVGRQSQDLCFSDIEKKRVEKDW